MNQILHKSEELKKVAESIATIHNWDSPYAQPLLVDFRKVNESIFFFHQNSEEIIKNFCDFV